jgi:hypothetical protein
MNAKLWRIRVLAVLRVSLCAISMVLPSLQTSLLAQAEEVLIDDPRPVAVAAQQFQRRCRCIVTYEDVKWQQSDVEDVSYRVRRAPNMGPVEVPKGRPFTLVLQQNLASKSSDEIQKMLASVLTASEAAGNTKSFRVVGGGGMLHIVPAKGGPFDASISIPEEPRTLEKFVSAVLQTVTEKTGERAVLATGPLNLLRAQMPAAVGANNERARDVLARGLRVATPSRKLSWQLLYDFSRHRYYLSLQFVS